MKKIFNYLCENIDKLGFCLFGSLLIGLGFNIGSYLIFNSSYVEEKQCVEFYKENNYVLDVCKNYEEKLKK